MEGHRTAERRSLVYHHEIARRLRDDPSLVERARAVVRRRLANGEHGSSEWSLLLEAPLERLLDAITSEDERMVNLRQMTPFFDILDARTRWALWRTTR